MTQKRYIEPLLLSALSALALIVAGCSDADERETTPVVVSEGEPLQVSHFTRYSETDDDYDNLTMWIIAIPDDPKEKTQTGIVSFNGVADDNSLNWNSAIYVKNSITYEMFGFIPSYIANSETSGISENTAGTAKLTLNGLKSLSNEDVCIITGAVNGAPANLSPTDRLYRGVYTYKPLYGDTRYGVRLLADHIYASLKFGIYIDGDYDARRTIKLKKMEVRSSQEALVNAVLTLNKSEGTATPFTFVSHAGTGTDKASQVIFEDAEGQEIMTAAAVASMTDEKKAAYNMISPLFFGEWLKNDLSLVSTYDVYDKKGNLTRENCTATNKLSSAKISALGIGKRDSITLTVNPSYLYVLSDPDQSPEVVIK